MQGGIEKDSPQDIYTIVQREYVLLNGFLSSTIGSTVEQNI
jgi:hypothetical protein